MCNIRQHKPCRNRHVPERYGHLWRGRGLSVVQILRDSCWINHQHEQNRQAQMPAACLRMSITETPCLVQAGFGLSDNCTSQHKSPDNGMRKRMRPLQERGGHASTSAVVSRKRFSHKNRRGQGQTQGDIPFRAYSGFCVPDFRQIHPDPEPARIMCCR